MVTDVIEKTCHMVFGDSVHPGEDGLALYYGRGSVRGVAPKCENRHSERSDGTPARLEYIISGWLLAAGRNLWNLTDLPATGEPPIASL